MNEKTADNLWGQVFGEGWYTVNEVASTQRRLDICGALVPRTGISKELTSNLNIWLINIWPMTQVNVFVNTGQIWQRNISESIFAQFNRPLQYKRVKCFVQLCIYTDTNPVNTTHYPFVSVQGQRLWRWPNTETTQTQCIVFTGNRM